MTSSSSSSSSSLQEVGLDVIDFVVKKGNGVKGLADTGIEAVPSHYIQPPDKRLTAAEKSISDHSIPVIDFSKLDDPATEDAIFDAAVEWGFFQIVNHGIPGELMDDLKRSAHRVFELPVAEKRRFQTGSPSDSVRLSTSFSPSSDRVLEWRDILSMLYVSDDQALASWPPQCRKEGVEYMKRCQIVIERLLRVLLKRLNVTEIDNEDTRRKLMGGMRLNFNYYPKCPDPELTVGVKPHSDLSSITVLLQDPSGGLYVRREGGPGWVHVAPVNEALVVNIGDVLQIMSNGLYKSIEHRAVANKDTVRVSIPIFVNPRLDAFIGPLPGKEKPIYKEVLFSDYFEYFFSKLHDGKSTIDFVKIDH